MRDSGLSGTSASDSTITTIDSIRFTPGEVNIQVFEDGSVLVGLYGTAADVSVDIEATTNELAKAISNLKAPETGALIIDLSNVSAVPDNLKMALGWKCARREGETRGEVILLEPTVQVLGWIRQGSLDDLCTIAPDRSKVLSGREVDLQRSQELAASVEEKITAFDREVRSSAGVGYREQVAQQLTIRELGTSFREPIFLVATSHGTFSGKSGQGRISELVPGSGKAVAPIVLDLTASDNLDSEGTMEVMKLAKSLTPEGKTLHLAILPGSGVEQKVKQYRLGNMQGIKIHSTPDDALEQYTG